MNHGRTRTWPARAGPIALLAGVLALASITLGRAEEPVGSKPSAAAPAPPAARGNDLLHIGLAMLRLSRLTASRTMDPLHWAEVEDAFGLAQLKLGTAEGDMGRLSEAVTAFRNALEVRTRERYPLTWAETQAHLGDALRILGTHQHDPAGLEEAVAAYRAALSKRPRDQAPMAWAVLQSNLGLALWALGENTKSAPRLDEAAIAFRMALGEFDRQRTPGEWLTAQGRLGAVLMSSDALVEDLAKVALAAKASRAVLGQRDRRREPLVWAGAQFDLARALARLGKRELGTANLQEAVDAYRAALEEYPAGSEDWRRAQFNLGYVLESLGERQGGSDLLKEALQIYTDLLDPEAREQAPVRWAMAQNNICVVQRAIGERTHDGVRLRDAVARCRLAFDALETTDQEHRSMVQDSLGEALTALGTEERDDGQLRAAITAFDDALGVEARQNDPEQAAGSRGRQAIAMMHLAARTADPGLADRALAQLEAASAALRQRNRPALAAAFERRLPEARALRDRLASR